MASTSVSKKAWKGKAWVLVGVVGLLLAPMPTAAAASLNNAGFETGNFSGWSVVVPPGAFAGVVTSYTGTETGFLTTPFNGRFFAVLKTNGPGSQTRVFQSVGLAAGETLTGAAFFKAEDYCPYDDNAQVLVRRSSGALVAVVFSSSVCSVGNYGYTGWRTWSISAPAADTYTVEARIANNGDGSLDSFMGIDSAQALDTTPPVTSTTVSPLANGNGWHNTDVTLGFFATDSGSGVKNIIYQVDGGAPVTVPGASAGTTLTTEGPHSVTYYATDNAGNAAPLKTVNVKIDKTAPTIAAANSPAANAAGWNNGPVTTGFSCADGLSGVATCSDDSYTDAEGTTIVTGYATDMAGNTAKASSTIMIDATAPTCTATPDPSSIWPPNHKMVAVNMAIGSSDGLSGVAGWILSSATSDEPDNGQGDGDKADDLQGWALGTADAGGQVRAERSGSGDGRVYTLAYEVEDAAGNMASCSGTVMVPHSQGA